MKYLVLLVVLVIAYGVWRSQRQAAVRQARRPAAAPRQLQTMVACAHCGVHLPQADAVLAEGLPYCSEAHRRLGPAA